jgi:protein-S-isoprenylcysteine O-methyltransferase Ste14
MSRLTKVGNEVASPPASTRPTSCVSGWAALTGLAGFFVSLVLMHGTTLSPIHRSFVALAATVLPVIILDLFALRVHQRASTGLVWRRLPSTGAINARILERVLVKLIGLAGTLALIGACYWLFPIYSEPFYRPYWSALRQVAPWFVLAAPVYVSYVDRRMADPYDGYWQAGMAVLGRLDRVDRGVLWQYALGWIIKGYFLPLMFIYLTNRIDEVLGADVFAGQDDFLAYYRFAWDLSFVVDLVFVTAGYSLTLRLIDSHIRSSDPTMIGWAVALSCYPPFSNLLFDRYLEYDDETTWGSWLSGFPLLQMAWGAAVIALLAVYAWSSVAFGCRFSNLTHRGIVTHGPYRWSKHPAYISKNLSWWLVSVPFVSDAGVTEAIRHCLLLLGVNAIYYARARTEEWHLSRDPVYVDYALWIERRGLLRILGEILPFLRYKPRLKHPPT